MKMKKLAMVLAAIMVLTNAPLTVWADAIPTEGNPIYVDDGSTVEYTGDISNVSDYDLAVVAAYGGSTVILTGDVSYSADEFSIPGVDA